MNTLKGKGSKVKPLNYREKIEQCNVVGAHAFVLKVSSIFGLAPLRFKSHANGYFVSVSIPMCIYSYLLMSFIIVLTLFGTISELKQGISPYRHMTSYLSQVMSCCDITVLLILASAGVYGAPKRMRSMIKLMCTIASVDKSIDTKYNHTRERRLCAGFLIFVCILSAMLIDDIQFCMRQASTAHKEWNILLHYFGFYLLWYFITIFEVQFAYTAITVHSRFKTINDNLTVIVKQLSEIYMQKETNSDILNVINNGAVPTDVPGRSPQTFLAKKPVTAPHQLSSASDSLHLIASVRGTLYDVVHDLESSYGISLVIILVSTLFHLIVTPYFVILERDIRGSGNIYHFVLQQSMWNLLHVLRLFTVVEPCHYTAEEGTKTERLVCRMMAICPTSGALAARLEVFSRQLMMQPISYKPMGTCTLDRPLIATIFGAVTTYLVILIQFQNYES